MGIYLERPQLFLGGLMCIIIAAALGFLLKKTIGAVLAGVFGIVGSVGIIGAFGGRNADTLQFFLVCIVFAFAGIAIASSGGLPAKVAGFGIAAVAAFAFFNSSTVNLQVPFMDRDFVRGVSAAFRETGRQIERIFEEASGPNQNGGRDREGNGQRQR